MRVAFSILEEVLDFEDEHDLRIFALGYESRSSHLVSEISSYCSNSYAFAFDFNQVLAWDDNKRKFEEKGVKIVECTDSDFQHELLSIFEALKPLQKELKVFVDISSFSRFRLASLVETVAQCFQHGTIITFGYTTAKFTKPINDESPITKFLPVTNHFAGYPSDPEVPVVCILGLGYDQGRAIGAIEYLEVGEAWLFKPISREPKYSEALEAANQWLLEMNGKFILDYDVATPIRTYSRLWSLVRSKLLDGRPVLIPFGPKIFTLCNLLLAENLFPKVPVWHVSSSLDNPVNRIPDYVVSLKTQLVQRNSKLIESEEYFGSK